MANGTNKPYGLSPIRYLNGSPWNGAVTQYYVTGGTDIFVGDLVTLGGTAGAAGVTVNGIDCEGMPTVIASSAGGNVVGVCVGILPTTGESTLHYASGDAIALVVDDPNVVFRIQESSVTTSLQIAQIGNNFDIIATAGSTTTGISKHVLNSEDTSGTGTAQLRVLRLARPDRGTNPISTAGAAGNYADFEVIINEHSFKSTTGV